MNNGSGRSVAAAVILLWWAAFGFPGVAFFVILDTEMDMENEKCSIYALFSV